MRIKRIVPAALAATALMAGGAAPAADAGKHKRKCVGNDAGAYACFQAYGDKFFLKDTTANAMSAGVVWKTSYGREGTCVNVHGKGKWVVCEYNMRESGTIKFWTVDIDTPTDAHRNWSAPRRSNI
jgi:hypothetical protein